MSITKKEIILETIRHIKKNGQSLSAGDVYGCRYKGENGNRCAFARCMDIRKYKPSMEGDSVVGLVTHDHIEGLDDILKKRYRGHESDFWHDLQKLHDRREYWINTADGAEITPSGVVFATKELPQSWQFTLADEEIREIKA